MSDDVTQTTRSDEVIDLLIDQLEPDPAQPRKVFEDIEGLAKTIKDQGLLQPITVRQVDNGRYVIVAGERRWRACQVAGLSKVRCIVRRGGPTDDTAVVALIENIQRASLKPVEEAIGLKRLKEQFGYSDEDLAERLSRSRQAISESLSLLRLPQRVLDYCLTPDEGECRRAGISSKRVLLHLLRLPSREQLAAFEKLRSEGPEALSSIGFRKRRRRRKRAGGVEAGPAEGTECGNPDPARPAEAPAVAAQPEEVLPCGGELEAVLQNAHRLLVDHLRRLASIPDQEIKAVREAGLELRSMLSFWLRETGDALASRGVHLPNAIEAELAELGAGILGIASCDHSDSVSDI